MSFVTLQAQFGGKVCFTIFEHTMLDLKFVPSPVLCSESDKVDGFNHYLFETS